MAQRRGRGVYTGEWRTGRRVDGEEDENDTSSGLREGRPRETKEKAREGEKDLSGPRRRRRSIPYQRRRANAIGYHFLYDSRYICTHRAGSKWHGRWTTRQSLAIFGRNRFRETRNTGEKLINYCYQLNVSFFQVATTFIYVNSWHQSNVFFF